MVRACRQRLNHPPARVSLYRAIRLRGIWLIVNIGNGLSADHIATYSCKGPKSHLQIIDNASPRNPVVNRNVLRWFCLRVSQVERIVMDHDRRCMSDRIRDSLASKIFDGTLQPGDRRVELEIAKEFQTSQTPVREALRELESLCLVESAPDRGTLVRGISEREMVEAYTIRGAFEQLAAELAAPRLKGNVRAIRASLALIHESARVRDVDGYTRHNMDFHRAIVVASNNDVLVQSWGRLVFEARVRLHLRSMREPRLMERACEHDRPVNS